MTEMEFKPPRGEIPTDLVHLTSFFSAVLWDNDGTAVDSEQPAMDSARRLSNGLLAEAGCPPYGFESFVTTYGCHPYREILTRLIANHPGLARLIDEEKFEVLVKEEEHLAQEALRTVRATPGTDDVLALLC